MFLTNVVFTLVWYIYWRRKKQQREALLGGTIIPLFYPPTLPVGSAQRPLNPSEIHYALALQQDPKQFAAEVVNMGVKGLLEIEYKPSIVWGSGTYTLTKKRDCNEQDLQLHHIVQQKLFFGRDSVQLTQTYQATLENVKSALDGQMMLALGGMFISEPFVILTPAALGGASLLIAMLMTGFSSAFAICALVFYVFAGIWGNYITKTYTPEGCVLKNQILGFKLFLAATETDRMEVIGTPPTKTPELYEKYLPYAIALGVEKQWTKQFASVFAQLEKQGVHYQPLWYHGGSFETFNATALTSQISNSLQSASQSSGGGGMGSSSSGGGRGGGGGGSW